MFITVLFVRNGYYLSQKEFGLRLKANLLLSTLCSSSLARTGNGKRPTVLSRFKTAFQQCVIFSLPYISADRSALLNRLRIKLTPN